MGGESRSHTRRSTFRSARRTMPRSTRRRRRRGGAAHGAALPTRPAATTPRRSTTLAHAAQTTRRAATHARSSGDDVAMHPPLAHLSSSLLFTCGTSKACCYVSRGWASFGMARCGADRSQTGCFMFKPRVVFYRSSVFDSLQVLTAAQLQPAHSTHHRPLPCGAPCMAFRRGYRGRLRSHSRSHVSLACWGGVSFHLQSSVDRVIVARCSCHSAPSVLLRRAARACDCRGGPRRALALPLSLGFVLA